MFSPYEDAPTVMKGTLRSNPETKVVVILKDEVNPEATVSTNMNCGGKLTRDCSGDGVTGDGGYGYVTGEAFSPVNTLKIPDFELIFTVCNR